MDLVMAVADEADRLLLLTLMRTGARFMEAASVPPDALDPRNNTIWLESTWGPSGEKEPVAATRTRSNEDVAMVAKWIQTPLKVGIARHINLPPQLIQALVDWRDHRLPKPTGRRKDVLFPMIRKEQRLGVGIWTPSDWRTQVMMPARATARLPALRTKDLRMMAASNFHDAGFSDAQVAELLGHAEGSGITKRHYVRPVADVHDAAREAIRLNPNLSPQQRLEALWDAWVQGTGRKPV